LSTVNRNKAKLGMINREIISEMLHRMDAGKRLEAIVTELVFRRTYGYSELSPAATYGWMTTDSSCAERRKKFGRDWYICAKSVNEIASCTSALINAFERKDYRFFLVTDIVIHNSAGTVEFRVLKLENNEGGVQAYLDKAITADLMEKVNARVRRVHGQAAISTWSILPYLQHVESDELLSLYTSRCLMDFGLDFPTDIDAVDVSSGKLIVYEFKRKDPSDSYYMPNSHVSLPSYGKYFENVKKSLLNNQGNSTRNDTHSELITNHNATFYEMQCYGLDYRSHVKNFITCNFNGVVYRYVIWNRSQDPIPEMVAPNLFPLGSFILMQADLKPASFAGFNFTEPRKSGDVQKKRITRFQCMVPKSHFTPAQCWWGRITT